ncbi:DNA-binding response regulator [Halalkalibacter oceani]|uniref:DNA-binding response regulator n=1 Tax=Halalkalibacter oceani TaxID=1653776 RepID=UPI00339184CD
MIINKNNVEQALRDYHWMPKEIERIKKRLEEMDTSVTAMYGIEASLPKPKGVHTDKVGNAVIRNEKQHRYLKKLQAKMKLVEDNIDSIEDDREKAVLFCMLDGMTQVSISLHLGLSEAKVSKIKYSIVNRMYENVKELKKVKV